MKKITLPVAGIIIAGVFFLPYYNQKDATLITIEATFMQYACGEEFDDMQVEKVNNPAYVFLMGNDIDPYVDKKENNLKNYFYDNREANNGLTYRLTGYLSKKNGGCDGDARCFRVESIEMLNGENKKLKKDF